MTQEDKELLLKDLCARLPYEVKLLYNSDSIARIKDRVEILRGVTVGYTIWYETNYNHSEYDSTSGSYNHFKPYLRSMSSITKDEAKEYYETMDKYTHRLYPNSCDWSEHTEYSWTIETFDWLNAHHFDFRGLIEKGLALEAPEGMYNIK